MNLSEHFSLQELIESDAAIRLGISNYPPPAALENLKRLCDVALEPLRAALDKPLIITSGYRVAELNRAIGGAKNSAHMLGLAADVQVHGMSPAEVARALFAARVPFDQAIIEFGRWLHVSIAAPGATPRRDFLSAVRVDGSVVYRPAMLNVEGS